jgi:arylamine N-acetyltransferase
MTYRDDAAAMRSRAETVALFEERHGRTPPDGSPATLVELVRRFSALPYENLSKILAPGPRMPLTVVREHLELGTGGTCFSLAELLGRLARAAGFSAHPVMAHMRHGPNVHCALRVEASNGAAFLVDPGYLLPGPRPLAPGPVGEPAPGQPLLVPAGSRQGPPADTPAGDVDLFTHEPGGLVWRYRFSHPAPTREAFWAHWQRSFGLPGMRSLLVTRREGDQRLYLHRHKLRRVGPGGKTTRNVRQRLEQTVAETFGIAPRVTREAGAVLRQGQKSVFC